LFNSDIPLITYKQLNQSQITFVLGYLESNKQM